MSPEQPKKKENPAEAELESKDKKKGTLAVHGTALDLAMLSPEVRKKLHEAGEAVVLEKPEPIPEIDFTELKRQTKKQKPP